MNSLYKQMMDLHLIDNQTAPLVDGKMDELSQCLEMMLHDDTLSDNTKDRTQLFIDARSK